MAELGGRGGVVDGWRLFELRKEDVVKAHFV